ncbi:glycosyltransferase 87 family protein [Nonomuraea aridisoli]|uniref:DUF2029 domain-containing protein n=1 Tax=Nonomuraea aridisoli TaxID=2070368 RepID=A0A2W2FDI6_9ACTN|nr:glycosyltransferase 87 family protein [Nonomuraea aridisoli]PZG23480.1 hypothetical protein C1J01_00720 [Nonomuraea aridisoli]
MPRSGQGPSEVRSAPGRVIGVAGAAVPLVALVGALAVTMRAGSLATDPAGLLGPYTICWALFAVTVWRLRRLSGRAAVFLVVAGGIAVTATGLLAPPATSTDSFRYAWDGRVQAAGLSPYDRAPADPALAPLRDRWLFPEGAACRGRDRYPLPSATGARSCTRINRPTVHTIYPPLAQAYFWVVDRLSPEGSRHKPLQAGGAVLAFATTLVLLRVAPARAAWWAWCPAVPVEAVNNAHVDVLGVLLTVVALIAVVRHGVLGGALLGAATAVKLLPAVTLPGALSGLLTRPRRVPDALAVVGAAVLVVALAYLPYVLASRASVLGYLFGYVNEEGYGDTGGNRYAVLRLLLPDSWAVPAALAVVAAAAVVVLWRGDAERPWQGALTVTGVAFLAFTPGYSWYALLVVALVALDGRWEWLAVPVAGAVAYLGRAEPTAGTAAYVAAALVVAGAAAVRLRSPAGRALPPPPQRVQQP